MVYASSDLINEHEGILFSLRILEKMVFGLGNTSVEISDFQDMTGFFSLFADKCHHGKEEGLFFPALEKAGVPNQNGPIGQMLLEHTEGRKFLARMTAALTDYPDKKNALVDASTQYIHLLRNHIEKENTVLFPMADKRIPFDIQTKLLVSFEEFEEHVMGKGTHEKLHELLHTFEKKYL